LSTRNSAISQAHTDCGTMLKIMMKHHQVSIVQGAELFGISESTLLSYRNGHITIGYGPCMRIISTLEPSAHMRLQFISACQHAVLEAWRNPGTKSSKKRAL